VKELIEALAQQHDLEEFIVCEAIHTAIRNKVSPDQFKSMNRDQIIILSRAPLDCKATIEKK
jgi:hypothetical protein